MKLKLHLPFRPSQMLATHVFLRMNISAFLSLCIDFAGELSGSHLVTSGLQLLRVPEESEEETRSYTKKNKGRGKFILRRKSKMMDSIVSKV
jgi:hypothetical protein